MRFKINIILLLSFCICQKVRAIQSNQYKPYKIGYSIPLSKITEEEMQKAKNAGIDYIEVGGWNGVLDKQSRELTLDDKELESKMQYIKRALDKTGMKAWSVHMPYGRDEDISVLDEEARQRTLNTHKKIIKYMGMLKPQIVLFHPSWYLGVNEREQRKEQLVKSSVELNKAVKKIGAEMVIENMLGPKLLKSPEQERPLCRSVEETMEIMQKLPQDIYAAVDMNHIKSPEKLIESLGSRLKSIHVADGDGLAERHYFPCSGEGKNDWNAIQSALYKAGYQGAFIYECKYPSLEELKSCYDTLYSNFMSATN